MDIIIGVEIALVAFLVAVQFFSFSRNKSKINTLEELYPDTGLRISRQHAEGVDLIEPQPHFSKGFIRLISATNLYLYKNKGAAADFNILRDISERESEALENEIDTTIAFPLYIGLMGTFLGVIIGLVKLAFFEGINDESIQSFLGGVMIGMIASAVGLMLTTLGNYQFKQAKLYRDRNRNDYYTFMQAELLPSLTSDMAGSLITLKSNLDAFNQEFSVNIHSFKGTISNISENITLQKEFLETLRSIGYNQMATANVEVFSKIEKSLPVFDRFIQSIQEANQLTDQARNSFEAIRQIMEDLRGFREGVNGLGQYIRENDNLIDKQVKYLNAYINTAAQATDSMGKHFDRADDAITQFVERRISVLMEDSRKAAVQIEDYFARLREDNIHVKLAQQIESLQLEVKKLGNGVEHLQHRSVASESFSPKEARDLMQSLKQPARSRDFVNSAPFKVFVYMSGIFYSLGLAILLGYLLSLLLRL
jgi:methyl-accepting chemotaxis protein